MPAESAGGGMVIAAAPSTPRRRRRSPSREDVHSLAVRYLAATRQELASSLDLDTVETIAFEIGRLRPKDTTGTSLAALKRYLATSESPDEWSEGSGLFGTGRTSDEATPKAIAARWSGAIDPAVIAAVVVAMERTGWSSERLNARDLLASVRGKELTTAEGFTVKVGRDTGPSDVAPVLRRLYSGEKVRIDMRELGYRSALLGALLLQIDGTEVLRDPLSIALRGDIGSVPGTAAHGDDDTTRPSSGIDGGAPDSEDARHPFVGVGDVDERSQLARARPEQRKFRSEVLARYGESCAMCGITAVELLEAAHLLPASHGGVYDARNGLVLCANHHEALDRGLVAIVPVTTRFLYAAGCSAEALGVTRESLADLPALPHPSALEGLWAMRGEPHCRPH